jgi:hypothetical protein
MYKNISIVENYNIFEGLVIDDKKLKIKIF